MYGIDIAQWLVSKIICRPPFCFQSIASDITPQKSIKIDTIQWKGDETCQ